TPIGEASGLRDALGGPRRCPRILLKRDDLTGLALGGNKARKLEFLIADACRQGATAVVTTGAVQSNHARMTAAAARAAGLALAPVLRERFEGHAGRARARSASVSAAVQIMRRRRQRGRRREARARRPSGDRGGCAPRRRRRGALRRAVDRPAVHRRGIWN